MPLLSFTNHLLPVLVTSVLCKAGQYEDAKEFVDTVHVVFSVSFVSPTTIIFIVYGIFGWIDIYL